MQQQVRRSHSVGWEGCSFLGEQCMQLLVVAGKLIFMWLGELK